MLEDALLSLFCVVKEAFEGLHGLSTVGPLGEGEMGLRRRGEDGTERGPSLNSLERKRERERERETVAHPLQHRCPIYHSGVEEVGCNRWHRLPRRNTDDLLITHADEDITDRFQRIRQGHVIP